MRKFAVSFTANTIAFLFCAILLRIAWLVRDSKGDLFLVWVLAVFILWFLKKEE